MIVSILDRCPSGVAFIVKVLFVIYAAFCVLNVNINRRKCVAASEAV